MSSDDSRKNRIDSGYGTDIVPSPMSANLTNQPVFFGDGEPDDITALSVRLTDQTRPDTSHQPSEGNECVTVQGVTDNGEQFEDDDIENSVFEPGESTNCNIAHTKSLEDDEIKPQLEPVRSSEIAGAMSACRMSCVFAERTPRKRSTSLPDIKTMRMRASKEVGCRLRRLSDEFYYSVLFRCQTCSVLAQQDHADDVR